MLSCGKGYGRDPQSLGSALLDTGKGVWNGGVSLVEGVLNLFAGAPYLEDRDYNPFLSGVRAQYDTPVFGAAIEVLTGVGAFKVLGDVGAARPMAPTGEPGAFSIVDWGGYSGRCAKTARHVPAVGRCGVRGSFRAAANQANSALRKEQGLVGKQVDVHEIKPVKFNGSPTDPANKVVLPRDIHRQQVTPWWESVAARSPRAMTIMATVKEVLKDWPLSGSL